MEKRATLFSFSRYRRILLFVEFVLMATWTRIIRVTHCHVLKRHGCSLQTLTLILNRFLSDMLFLYFFTMYRETSSYVFRVLDVYQQNTLLQTTQLPLIKFLFFNFCATIARHALRDQDRTTFSLYSSSFAFFYFQSWLHVVNINFRKVLLAFIIKCNIV